MILAASDDVLRGAARLLRLGLLARRSATWGSSSSSSSGSRSRYWVFKDARRRIEDPWLVAMATVLGLVRRSSGRSSTCSSVRPSTSRTCASASSRSRRWRSASPGASSTARSAARRRPDVPRLPGLHDTAQQACESCKAPLEPLWQVCPYCETPIESPTPSHFPPARRAAQRNRRAASRVRRRWRLERTLVLIKPDAMRRGLAGEILRPVRGARARAPRGAARHGRPGARGGALRRARGEAVLRRAGRVHHLGADAGARARGRRRDRGRPLDDGRDEPGRRGARDDPRRPRALDAGQPRPRLRLAGVGAARDRALV